MVQSSTNFHKVFSLKQKLAPNFVKAFLIVETSPLICFVNQLIDFHMMGEVPIKVSLRRLVPTNILSVFDHFVGLAFKGLKKS